MHSLGTGTLNWARIDAPINAIVDSSDIRMCSISLILLDNIRLPCMCCRLAWPPAAVFYLVGSTYELTARGTRVPDLS
jgi:hypothetical protein